MPSNTVEQETQSRIRQFVGRLFRRNGEEFDEEPVVTEEPVAEYGEDITGSPDWADESPTDKQLRYIKVLGGDPSSVDSKHDASNLIDRLLRMRGRSLLDPERLAERGRQAGAEANGEWRSAHSKLLGGLLLDLQEHVNLSLGNLRTQLSDPLGPRGTLQSQGPREMVRRAEEELKRLVLCRQWSQPVEGLLMMGMGDGRSSVDDPQEGQAVAPAETTSGAGVDSEFHWTRWLSLVTVFAVCVMVEAVANIGLLMEALPGGALAAFLLAVLVSTINVGGLGIGVGLLLSQMRRSFGGRWLGLAFGGWITSVLGFNLIAGRHREAFAQVVEQVRVNPTAPLPAVRDVLPGVPLNPFTWELQALLFALLGVFLCTVGFAKGFTFIRNRKEASEASAQDGGREQDGSRATSQANRSVFTVFASLPQRYLDLLTGALREYVANRFRALDRERRTVTTLLDTLKVEENRQACIDIAEHAFIVAYNENHPDKITIEEVESYRRDKRVGPLTATVVDSQVLGEADAEVAKWRESGQAQFDERIETAHKEIVAIWDRYKPLVLGTPEHPAGSNGARAAPGTTGSGS